MNAKNTNSLSYSSEDTELEQVANTPFGVLRRGKDWSTVMGDYVLKSGMATKEEALEDAEREDWHRIMQVIETTVKLINRKNG